MQLTFHAIKYLCKRAEISYSWCKAPDILGCEKMYFKIYHFPLLALWFKAYNLRFFGGDLFLFFLHNDEVGVSIEK